MLRSLVFLIYALISSVILAIVFITLLPFGQRGAQMGARLWSGNCVLAAKYILGITYVVKGKLHSKSAVYASRHESAWETVFLQMYLPRTVFILKRELMWIPLFNVYMLLAGHIGVNRSKGSKTLKRMVKDSKKALDNGNNIIIFPEGTRVKPGHKGSIKPGIMAIYTMGKDIPIIPVSLNSGQFWGKNAFIKKPGKITVTFHEPIEAGLDKKQFAEKLESIISQDAKN